MSGEQNSKQLPAALVTAARLADAPAATWGLVYVSAYAVAAGITGAADDVTLQNADFPRKCKLAALEWTTTTAVALSTVTIRDAAGGGGNALCGPQAGTDTNTRCDKGLAFTAVSSGASVYLRRNNDNVAGHLVCYWVPSA